MFKAINAYGGDDIIFDAEKLDYISSAGLRLILKVQKQNKKPIKMINISESIYEIFELAGFTDLLELKKA